MIYVEENYILCMWHNDHSFRAKIVRKHRMIANIHLWLCTTSYDWSNSMPIWLSCNYVIHSVYNEITL